MFSRILILFEKMEEQDKKDFWEYKLNRMEIGLILLLPVFLTVCVGNIITFAISRNAEQGGVTLLTILGTILWIAILLMNRKWPGSFVYIVPLFRIIIAVMFVLFLPDLNICESECN